jgi:hypothetical protein
VLQLLHPNLFDQSVCLCYQTIIAVRHLSQFSNISVDSLNCFRLLSTCLPLLILSSYTSSTSNNNNEFSNCPLVLPPGSGFIHNNRQCILCRYAISTSKYQPKSYHQAPKERTPEPTYSCGNDSFLCKKNNNNKGNNSVTFGHGVIGR